MEFFLVEFLSRNIRDTNTSLEIQELVSSSLGLQVGCNYLRTFHSVYWRKDVYSRVTNFVYDSIRILLF